MYGGGVVYWESCRQPFSTFSTAESELVGYCEAMVLGDSLGAVMCLFEDEFWGLESGDR